VTFSAVALLVTGCSLVTSLDGLSGGAASAEAGTPGEAGTTSDASGDASVDALGTDAVAPIDPDLVAWWKLDEGQGSAARDSSGKNNDGLLATGASWSPGKIGTALSFDGVAGRALVANNATQQTITDGLTFATWLYVIAMPNADPRLLQWGGVWEVKLNDGAPQLSEILRYGILDWKMPLGAWHHLALTFDHGVMAGYVDGVAVGLSTNQFTGDKPLPTGTDGVAIGGVLTLNPSNGVGCNCRLDDVRVYRRALGAPEIAALAR
jgi:uncharacterized protein